MIFSGMIPVQLLFLNCFLEVQVWPLELNCMRSSFVMQLRVVQRAHNNFCDETWVSGHIQAVFSWRVCK